MRIAMLAPIWERVPPPAYGGIELVVSLLTEGLVARGHEVTLFATGDAETGATLMAVTPRPLRERGLTYPASIPIEMVHMDRCFRRAATFDVIHNHVGTAALAVAPYLATPVLTTLHGPIDPPSAAIYAQFADLPYVSISDAQRRGAPAGMRFVGTVYHGIETHRYAPAPKEGYLLNLGRISPEKGTHLAVEAARRTGRPLVIAGKVDPSDVAYYEEAIAPHLDGERVRYVGEVGGERKSALLAGASALLHPVQWPEPFGLVMAEALASGTPVIACPDGSIPEVVAHGRTGYVADSLEGLCEAIDRLEDLDPAECRREAVARFDAARMVAEYEALYDAVAGPAISLERTGLRASAWRAPSAG